MNTWLKGDCLDLVVTNGEGVDGNEVVAKGEGVDGNDVVAKGEAVEENDVGEDEFFFLLFLFMGFTLPSHIGHRSIQSALPWMNKL